MLLLLRATVHACCPSTGLERALPSIIVQCYGLAMQKWASDKANSEQHLVFATASWCRDERQFDIFEAVYISFQILDEALPDPQALCACAGIDMDLSEGQRAAVLRASTAPLVVLTGGPGCGKTFATRAIVELWASQGKHVRLAAPTGGLQGFQGEGFLFT